jgi:hypothetical protein
LEGNSLIKGTKFDRCSNPIGGCMIVQIDGKQQIVQLKKGALVSELIFPLSESLKIVPLN